MPPECFTDSVLLDRPKASFMSDRETTTNSPADQEWGERRGVNTEFLFLPLWTIFERSSSSNSRIEIIAQAIRFCWFSWKKKRLIIRLFIHFLFSISIFLIEKKKEKKIWEKKNKDNVYFIPFLLAKLLAYLSYSVWKYADF